MPREKFLEMWLGKLEEVIDKYRPDLMWFDSWLNEIPDEVKKEYLAYYFNAAEKWGKEVVVTFKQDDLPRSVAIDDYEKGRADKLTDFDWLTDDTISRGSWCYTQDLTIKSTDDVLDTLIDIVSKRGVLLLNISPKADGTIPEDQRNVLLGIGAWLDRFGEAIYDTRPFLVYGEGPTKMEKGGAFVRMKGGYTPDDIRFTRKGDTVYAIVLGWPGAEKEILIESFAKGKLPEGAKVESVTLLGCEGKLTWQQTDEGLKITTPSSKPDDMAIVLKVETDGLPAPAK
jgi:alpha-L-fucosidase